MSDDRSKDLLDLGVRMDPTLPPMTGTAQEDGGERVEQSGMPDEARAAPASLHFDLARLTGEDVASVVGQDEQARDAPTRLDATHGRDEHEES